MSTFIRKHPRSKSLIEDLKDIAAIDADDVNWAYAQEAILEAAHRLSQLERHEHQWGQDAEYKWYQSCKCPRCSATTNRYANEQAQAYGSEPKPSGEQRGR